MVFSIPKINISLQLVIVIASVVLFGHLLPESVQSTLYAISLFLKEMLLLTLPVIIFSCLFSCLLSFQSRAISLVLSLFFGVCLSNFMATIIGYGIGINSLNHINVILEKTNITGNELLPIWSYTFPKFIKNEIALIAGLILGCIFSVWRIKAIEAISEKLKTGVNIFLKKVFIPLLPLFALGFIIKMQHDDMLEQIVLTYAPILAVIITSYIIYLYFLFGLGARFQFYRWHRYIRNIFPASVLGFTTMSSMAALPMILSATEKNTGNKDLSQAIVPAAINIHMIGDSIGVPILALAILASFGFPLPDFMNFIIFSGYFVIARFAVAAVPGGGIYVMLPILETYLGFTAEMSLLITSIYLLFDPFLTATNVTGNGAFALILSKFFKKEEQ